EYRFTLLFVPSFNVSFRELRFTDDPRLAGQKYKYTHLDAGYGLNLNYGSRKWNYYFNLIPFLGYNEVSGQSEFSSDSEYGTAIKASYELGVAYFFNQHWQARAYGRSIEMPADEWSKVMTKVSGQPINVTDSRITVSGLSLAYIFSR